MMNNNKIKMIYSEYEERMIPYGFVRKYSANDEVKVGHEHFTWCEEDLVYYSDDVDGFGFFEEDTQKPYINCYGSRVDFIFDTI